MLMQSSSGSSISRGTVEPRGEREVLTTSAAYGLDERVLPDRRIRAGRFRLARGVRKPRLDAPRQEPAHEHNLPDNWGHGDPKSTYWPSSIDNPANGRGRSTTRPRRGAWRGRAVPLGDPGDSCVTADAASFDPREQGKWIRPEGTASVPLRTLNAGHETSRCMRDAGVHTTKQAESPLGRISPHQGRRKTRLNLPVTGRSEPDTWMHERLGEQGNLSTAQLYG
jgi:hypothetical protein